MSNPSPEQALASLLSQLALSFDGAIIGLAITYTAVRSIVNLSSTSAALHRILVAPTVAVSDLRSLLENSDSGDDGGDSVKQVVIVRGNVEAKSAVESGLKNLRNNGVLVSRETGDTAVAIQSTQMCIYSGWKGFFGWTSDLRALFTRNLRQRGSTSLRTVPFVLTDVGQRSHADYVVVNLEGSNHPLPLVTVYHKLQPIVATPYTFLQALFGHEYPVGLLDEEKILPLGKDISAVGICYFKNGIPEIKSCKELPYFLSELSKDQMIEELTSKTKVLFWSSIILSSLSFAILGYASMRHWNRWKQRWQQRQLERQRQIDLENVEAEIANEEIVDADGLPAELVCAVCIMRRRRCVFMPCAHFVCCQACAGSVGRQAAPKCPVCRRPVENLMRVYDS